MNPTETDIANRKPIWEALSKFYLDTELQEEDFKEICKTFHKSPYDLEEIMDIDRYEVFPVLQMNLLSVAGEWEGFDKDWLFSKCQKNYKKRTSRLFKFWYRANNRLWYWMKKDYWERVKKEMKNAPIH
ncbi:DUF7079 family protein [Cyclobacterium qasimii]|uniref:DUF7079 domain-containing protein n=1 Tax=Cyclobacterium qasimii TaxID=1350429 RepID=A0A512CHJ0_9BACT|nr:hypothetical protein [Cyclobacterium qasimii]GEO23520.1 hypothetical protein CQA01_40540 [Cyclobacterium qasimii]